MNFADLILSAFLHGGGMALSIFGHAFVTNPWPFLALGTMLVIGAIAPRRARR